jgi:hypothetical protein
MEPLNPSVSTQLAKVNKQAAEFIYLFIYYYYYYFLAVQFSDGDLT